MICGLAVTEEVKCLLVVAGALPSQKYLLNATLMLMEITENLASVL
jgi:hypothetical protein